MASLLLSFDKLEEGCIIGKCMLHVYFAHYLLEKNLRKVRYPEFRAQGP